MLKKVNNQCRYEKVNIQLKNYWKSNDVKRSMCLYP